MMGIGAYIGILWLGILLDVSMNLKGDFLKSGVPMSLQISFFPKGVRHKTCSLTA